MKFSCIVAGLVKGIPTIRFLELTAPAFEVCISIMIKVQSGVSHILPIQSVLDYLSQHLKLLPRLKRIDLRIPKQGAELEVEAIQRTVRRLRSIVYSSARDMSLRLVHPKPHGCCAGAGLSYAGASIIFHE